MSTYIIIQARTGSTRLPNKMLMPFFKDKGILQILLERIIAGFPKNFNKIIVATTDSVGDDRIVDLCEALGIKCFRGSEADVLGRFIGAARHYDADKIIRVCADNVFLDVRLLRELYEELSDTYYDYLSYCKSDGTPSIKTHYGLWAEGASLWALESIAKATNDSLYHEHVTNYIYSHPDKYKISFKKINDTIPGIENHDGIRLTIDTIEDFKLSQKIFQYLSDSDIPMASENIVNHVESHPEYLDIMKSIINQNAK